MSCLSEMFPWGPAGPAILKAMAPLGDDYWLQKYVIQGALKVPPTSGSSPPVFFLAHPGVNSSPRKPPLLWTSLPLPPSLPHGHSHLKA